MGKCAMKEINYIEQIFAERLNVSHFFRQLLFLYSEHKTIFRRVMLVEYFEWILDSICCYHFAIERK